MCVTEPEPAARLGDDIEVPEADHLEQVETVDDTTDADETDRPSERSSPLEAPEADALEQSVEVPFDDFER